MNLFQYLFDQIRRKLHIRKRKKILAQFDFQTKQNMLELSRRQNRPPQEVASQMIALGLEQYQLLEERFQIWGHLTQQQRDVAALVCLGYTKSEIGNLMNISVNTVKVHVRKIYKKYRVHTREHLAEMLKDWDFSAWQKRYDLDSV